MKENPQETAIVPTIKTTAELIPQPTARLVGKSLERDTLYDNRYYRLYYRGTRKRRFSD